MNLFKKLTLAILIGLIIPSIAIAERETDWNASNDPEVDKHSFESCRSPEPWEIHNALVTGTLLTNALKNAASTYKAKYGKELTVVLVARAGTDPGNTVLLNPNMTAKQIADYAEEAGANEHNHHQQQMKEKEAVSRFASDRKLKYSHLGFMVDVRKTGWDQDLAKRYNRAPEKFSTWTSVHLLKPCFDKKPYVHVGGAAWFYINKPYKYITKVWMFKPEVQERILANIQDSEYAGSLLAREYRVAASYASADVLEFENSNHWPLEMIAASTAPHRIHNRAQARDYLFKTGYRQSALQLTGKYALALSADWFVPAYLKTPHELQPYQGINVVMGTTEVDIERYIEQRGLITGKFEIEPPLMLLQKDPKEVEKEKREADPWNNGGGDR